MDRRRATQLLALFILVYAMADVSVLQAFCGNESLGIPPDHHSASLTNDSAQSGHETCSESKKAECQRLPDDEDYDHSHQCFCWQQIVVGSFRFDSALITELIETCRPSSHENKRPDSDLQTFFRPPRSA